MSEPSIRLYSGDLFSKWGFNDGDDPDAWLDYCEAHGVDYNEIKYPLVELVRRHLLPVLDQAVTVVEIETLHNPIRAVTVDGIDVVGQWRVESTARLTPEYVDVPMTEILRMAKELAS